MSSLKALIKQHNERSGTLIEQFLLSFGHDEGNDKGKDADKETGNTKDEDLQKPSKEVLRSLFSKQIIEFSTLKHLMPTNLQIYDGSTVQDDHVSRLVGSANQWEWIIQKASETLINFKERWMDEMSYIQDVPEVMQISAFMSNSKCPALARRFSDQVLRTLTEMMKGVDDFIKSEEVYRSTNSQGESSQKRTQSITSGRPATKVYIWGRTQEDGLP
ncbi:hypothetical protein Tco_0041347 [Tanacetum coccineum]